MPTHTTKRSTPYATQDMFSIIANVEAYPQFLPWCEATRILKHTQNTDSEEIEADMILAFKMFREKIKSKVTIIPQEGLIKISYLSGPFKYMNAQWHITPTLQGGSNIEFFIDFQIRNLILKHLIGTVFSKAMQKITLAFENRAHLLHCQKIETENS